VVFRGLKERQTRRKGEDERERSKGERRGKEEMR
jgi:hypothetical protein